MRAMENDRRLEVGLDTPALCVDLDALESNITTMQARLGEGLGARPHAKTHKSADIARNSSPPAPPASARRR
jgi:D-serine deaminase-like pyridoxal phosphate-dependent protein